MKIKLLIVFGIRPEAIKMASLGKALEREDSIEAKVCVTVQHREMLNQALDVLEVEPNDEEFNEFELVDSKGALMQAYVVTFLVPHKEFKNLEIKTDLDFCGVINNA